MKLITQRDLIRTVAQRWHQQYDHRPDLDLPLFSVRKGIRTQLTKKEIAAHLDMLNPEVATAQEVNDIIGNNSWTRLRCDECGESVEAVVQVGQEPDYKRNTANLCEDCLRDAYLMMSDRDKVA